MSAAAATAMRPPSTGQTCTNCDIKPTISLVLLAAAAAAFGRFRAYGTHECFFMCVRFCAYAAGLPLCFLVGVLRSEIGAMRRAVP